MLVVFRADASVVIGSGHVARCLTLARALSERGAAVHFVSREHEGHLGDLIVRHGFGVSLLPVNAGEVDGRDRPSQADWLGSSWQDDVEQTRGVIKALGTRPEWLVVDHYALDARWEAAFRESVRRIFVIDDLGNRQHDCNLLLNQNLIAGMHDWYKDKIPANCETMLGPRYALLQPHYAPLHDSVPPRHGPIQRVLISFGGADKENLTGRAVAALLGLDCPQIEADVVIPGASPHAEALRRQVLGHSQVSLYDSLPTLAGLIARADLAIGASGATSWERLCLGLPALVVSLANNQRAIAEGLERAGVIRWLGHHDHVEEATIARALRDAIEAGSSEEQSRRGAALVDGRGVSRVCTAMALSSHTPLHVRPASVSDESSILELVDEAVGGAWHRNSSRDVAGQRLYVLETQWGDVVAAVRFTRINREWRVDQFTAPYVRARGTFRAAEAALLRFRIDESGVLILAAGVGALPGNSRLRLCVCSDSGSWINKSLPELLHGWTNDGHTVAWGHDAAAMPDGDICFYLSYSRIVEPDTLARFDHNLVVHASALPQGRGWSPLTWQILEGASAVPITLFEAEREVDSGVIYRQVMMEFSGTELIDELRKAVSNATRDLCRDFVAGYPSIVASGIPQVGAPSFYARRRPDDGRVDPDRPLREQFNLLRTADPEHYPAWFEIDGERFAITVRRLERPSAPVTR